LNNIFVSCSLVNRVAVYVIFLLLLGVAPGISSDNNICEKIAEQIEKTRNLPANILTSIATVEAGRRRSNGTVAPWPWSLNHAGNSLFFDTKLDAVKYLKKNITESFKNIDVGCMQVNVKWHFRHFDSFEDMLDPHKNIRYAASFLIKLEKQHGSWEKAIKHYHSSTNKLNVKYFAKVSKVWADKEEGSNIENAVLFLDDNIFYSENASLPIRNSSTDENKFLVQNEKQVIKLKPNEAKVGDDIYFNAVLLGNNRLESNEELKRYLKYKSTYLRENVDMILLFRQEFAKGK